MAEQGATTALMRQYLDVKARYPDAIVFFRLGDFYEMFHEDAVYAARVLDLTLTTRDKGKEDPVPMCGIPHHAVRPYLVKLTELGHRVALCEQLEDPRAVRGIVLPARDFGRASEGQYIGTKPRIYGTSTRPSVHSPTRLAFVS